MAKKKKRCTGKGSAFERKICQLLSLWVTGLVKKDVFWRSSMSGGRYTVKSKGGHRGAAAQAGDISAISPEGHALLDAFIVECKHHKTLDLLSVLRNADGNIHGWWEKLQEQCGTLNRHPMLIAKGNNMPELVFITKAGLDILDPERERVEVLMIYPRWGARVISFHQMIQTVPFKDIRAACKEVNK